MAIHYRRLLMLLLCAAAGSAAAPNMKLFGTLLVPPACTISDNGVIDVFFGDNVGVHKVDGVNYTRRSITPWCVRTILKAGIWDCRLPVRSAGLMMRPYRPIFPTWRFT